MPAFLYFAAWMALCGCAFLFFGFETGNRSLVLFDSGDEIEVQAGEDGIRFLLVSGKPLQEPVAWYGPIVMNTQEELQQAYQELQKGTFLKTA